MDPHSFILLNINFKTDIDIAKVNLVNHFREMKIMSSPIIDSITAYIKTQSRNKIIFHRNEIPELVSVNIGYRISEGIYNTKETRKISMIATAEIDRLLNAAIISHDLFGRYLSLQNLGIFFEPEIKLNFTQLLDNYSQNNVLFVHWVGEIDTENLYFLTKENGIITEIKNLSHIVI